MFPCIPFNFAMHFDIGMSEIPPYYGASNFSWYLRGVSSTRFLLYYLGFCTFPRVLELSLWNSPHSTELIFGFVLLWLFVGFLIAWIDSSKNQHLAENFSQFIITGKEKEVNYLEFCLMYILHYLQILNPTSQPFVLLIIPKVLIFWPLSQWIMAAADVALCLHGS